MTATIVYLHGLNSDPSSVKARALGAAIAALPVASRPEYSVPKLHHRPATAMRDVAAWIEARRPAALAFVGSSLGGFYATWLAECHDAKAVMINPSVRPFTDLERYLGPQRNLYSGEEYELTREHFAELGDAQDRAHHAARALFPAHTERRRSPRLAGSRGVLRWRVAVGARRRRSRVPGFRGADSIDTSLRGRGPAVKVRSYDVVVVGGGLVGAALGYGLADRSRQVAMLDEGDRALRAARGNFGLIWVQGKGADFSAYAAWTRGSARRWSELATRLREETGIDVALEQHGGVHLCLSERELEQRSALAAGPAAGADGVEMMDRAALHGLLPDIGPEVAGGSYCAADGHVDPLRLLRALHVAFVARGGSILGDCAVRTVAKHGDGFRLTTATGPIDAARVVLAAGLGNAALAPQLGLSAPVRAERGQIIALERMPAWLGLPIETLRQTAAGTVLAGDSQEPTASTDTSTGILAAIAARAVRAFPRLAEARVARCWAALRVLTPDRFPIYQQSLAAPGAFVATCHSGVTLAAAHALDLAPQIAAGALATQLLPFSSDRFDAAAAA